MRPAPDHDPAGASPGRAGRRAGDARRAGPTRCRPPTFAVPEPVTTTTVPPTTTTTTTTTDDADALDDRATPVARPCPDGDDALTIGAVRPCR